MPRDLDTTLVSFLSMHVSVRRHQISMQARAVPACEREAVRLMLLLQSMLTCCTFPYDLSLCPLHQAAVST